jgi:hypothetical protein
LNEKNKKKYQLKKYKIFRPIAPKSTFEQPCHKTAPEKLNQKSRKLYQMMSRETNKGELATRKKHIKTWQGSARRADLKGMTMLKTRIEKQHNTTHARAQSHYIYWLFATDVSVN